jgi:hypothetical protein
LRREAAKQVPWNETLDRHQDWDFIIRFANAFKIAPLPNVTCIVHWNSTDKYFKYFDSKQQFINTYKNKISPPVYNKYHRNAYERIRDSAAVDASIKKHYRLQAMKHIRFVSLMEFLDIHGARSSKKIRQLALRLLFLSKVLASRI